MDNQFNLVIHEHPDSIVKTLNNLRTILYPGFGRMSKPGRPSGNQTFERQKVFLKRYSGQGFIPIFYQEKDGNKHLIGNYILNDLNKKICSGGFQYYEYKFMKILTE